MIGIITKIQSILLMEGWNSIARTIVSSASCSSARLVWFGRTTNIVDIHKSHRVAIGACFFENKLGDIVTASRPRLSPANVWVTSALSQMSKTPCHCHLVLLCYALWKCLLSSFDIPLAKQNYLFHKLKEIKALAVLCGVRFLKNPNDGWGRHLRVERSWICNKSASWFRSIISYWEYPYVADDPMEINLRYICASFKTAE
jgi:hypothetical protein